jgi:hypothetical protein
MKSLRLARRDVTVAGRTIFMRVSEKAPRGGAPKKRGPKKNPTPDSVAAFNAHMAEKALHMKLNANFKAGDSHVVLTYAEPRPSPPEAAKKLGAFARKLARAYRREGAVLKWVSVTEYTNARIHHHMILSAGLAVDKLAKLWGHGGVRASFLYGKDYGFLAKYLIKETSKTFRDPAAAMRRRYSCSRSCVTPETKTETVSLGHLEKPREIKGYYVDKTSVWQGRNPFSGRRYMEYVLVSLTDAPRHVKWRRGKPRRLEGARSGWYARNGVEQYEMRGRP